jgi:predicted nuclease of predicted toxin-antitoxin system
MTFLADMNISLLTVEWLRSEGYEAIHVREQGLQRATDEYILSKARAEQRILLTMDLDFGYLMAVSHERLPSVILFRLGNDTSERVTQRLASVLNLRDLDWTTGTFVTVTDGTLRIRRLPL